MKVVGILLICKVGVVSYFDVLGPENESPNFSSCFFDPLDPNWPFFFKEVQPWLLKIGNIQHHEYHKDLNAQNNSIRKKQKENYHVKEGQNFVSRWYVEPPDNQIPKHCEENTRYNLESVAPEPDDHLAYEEKGVYHTW